MEYFDRRRKINDKEVIARYKAGEKVTEMAKDLGVSREAIYQILRKLPYIHQMRERLERERKQSTREKYISDREDVIKLKEDGLAMKTIAEALGIPYKRVREMLTGTHVDSSKEARAKRNQKIFKLYKKGLTQTEIAKKCNTSQSNVSNVLHRHFKDKL